MFLEATVKIVNLSLSQKHLGFLLRMKQEHDKYGTEQQQEYIQVTY